MAASIARSAAARAFRNRFGIGVEEAAGLRRCTFAPNLALVSLYDGELAGLDTDGGRWQTVCETHGSICSHETLALANAHLRHPDTEGWCEPCADGEPPFD